MNFFEKRFSYSQLKVIFNSMGERLNIISPFLYKYGFLKVKSFLKEMFIKRCVMASRVKEGDFFHWPISDADDYEKLKVSIIVPNYNHAQDLEKRLESIYNQTYKNYEVLLLDDCSNDNSREILEKYKTNFPGITRTEYNTDNSGSVFSQWEKGIELANGDLIWIAESDDWCDCDFLEKLVPAFRNEMVMLSYCRSDFVESGNKIFSTEEYYSDIPVLKASKEYVISAHDFVCHGMSIKNVIPNVSSVVFRKVDGMISREVHEKWKQLKLCGDWLFYLDRIRGGLVYYTPQTTNYYRIHRKSTSLNIQSTPRYYSEHQDIAVFVAEHYNVPLEKFTLLKKRLIEHWKAYNDSSPEIDVDKLFNMKYISDFAKKRKPNIVMCGYSMTMGGGETYPLLLANEFKITGQNITYVDFCLDKDDIKVRNMLNESVPLLRMKLVKYSAAFIESLGVDIIHTQHGMVDELVSDYLSKGNYKQCKQIITLHGMYEAINTIDRNRLLNKVKNTCAQFVYTADKNLQSFKETNIIDWHNFVKMDNGLPEIDINPIARSSIGICDDDFVFCLVSRGIREKGWQEAVEALQLANEKSKKKIVLIIIGDGIMYDALKTKQYNNVKLLGVKSNIRDYFAASDMGLLPSRFKGESYPLVVIDSLMTGRPVLASDIGESRHQLTDEHGNIAGMLFQLKNGDIPVDILADMMCDIANNESKYKQLKETTECVKRKFDIRKIAREYLNVYNKALEVCNEDESCA